MNMKFGLKLWSINTDLIDQAVRLIDEKIFDYIELFVIPDTSISPFMVDVPYIIHIPHHKFGVNTGDAAKKEYNVQKVNESITWANELDAKYLILHAGTGKMEHARCLLKEISESRLLIENMPGIGPNGEKMIGYSPEQMKDLISGGNRGLCLDFGHAVKAAITLKLRYKDVIDDFLKLQPQLFHISDGELENEKDSHLDIGSGSFDMKYFKNCIKNNKSKLITLETPRNNPLSLDEDLKNINILKSIWNL